MRSTMLVQKLDEGILSPGTLVCDRLAAFREELERRVAAYAVALCQRTVGLGIGVHICDDAVLLERKVPGDLLECRLKLLAVSAPRRGESYDGVVFRIKDDVIEGVRVEDERCWWRWGLDVGFNARLLGDAEVRRLDAKRGMEAVFGLQGGKSFEIACAVVRFRVTLSIEPLERWK